MMKCIKSIQIGNVESKKWVKYVVMKVAAIARHRNTHRQSIYTNSFSSTNDFHSNKMNKQIKMSIYLGNEIDRKYAMYTYAYINIFYCEKIKKSAKHQIMKRAKILRRRESRVCMCWFDSYGRSKWQSSVKRTKKKKGTATLRITSPATIRGNLEICHGFSHWVCISILEIKKLYFFQFRSLTNEMILRFDESS